jgi:hypothetical protein
MPEVKTGGDVQPGEFHFILHPQEYTEAGISSFTSKDRDQPYVFAWLQCNTRTMAHDHHS